MDNRARFYRSEADEGSLISAGYNQVVLSDFYSHLQSQRVSRVCDLGSGLGRNLPALRQSFPSARIIAVDLSWKALHAPSHGRFSTQPVQGDALSIPAKDQMFDLVACTEVLEHVADLDKAVEEIARVVRSGGCAVFSSPNYLNPMGARKWVKDRRLGTEYWDPWDGHSGFERWMYPRLVDRAAGRFFDILQVRGAGFTMAWLPLGYRRIGKWNDRFPLLWLGRRPIFRNVAMNRYLLLRRKSL